MTSMNYLFLAVGAFAGGWLGTMAIRKLASRVGLVQSPNERSSHSVPTPQGGGVAIAVIATLTAAALAGIFEPSFLIVAALCAILAGVGLADDLLELSPALRFPVQGMVIAALVGWALPLPDLVLPFGLAINGWLLPALIWLCALWWLNLFNFMDGIDGIAASQAIVILLGGLAISLSADPGFLATPFGVLALITAAATGGFLVMNWSPARIFMGDAGSNALALLIFAFCLGTVQRGLIGYPSWLILMSVFTTDATVALVRRTARGERPWRAHRRHAYQQLARRWGHRRVSVVYTGITALGAVPLAAAALHYPASAWWFVGVTYAALSSLAIWAGSGSAIERGR
nr:glycosyltransferase family 4 protein [uncultured Devosia sp.]